MNPGCWKNWTAYGEMTQQFLNGTSLSVVALELLQECLVDFTALLGSSRTTAGLGSDGGEMFHVGTNLRGGSGGTSWISEN